VDAAEGLAQDGDDRCSVACIAMAEDALPTARQMRVLRAAVRWYLDTHHGTSDDPGLAGTFCDATRVGRFAVDLQAVVEHDGPTLFRLLVATAMFQRQRDQQVTAILRSIAAEDVEEIGSAPRLLQLADSCGCEYARGVEPLRLRCDLTKDASKKGTCATRPEIACAPKRHTVLLRRYGHFGKVPTSAALAIREVGARDIPDMLTRTRASTRGRVARARALVATLSRSWRINEKIASMFLSLIANPDLTPGVTEWRDVDWRHFIVIDSNVDLFLHAIGYRGRATYDARRGFIRAASRQINLRQFGRGFRKDNPRIVQQALFVFMSASNRRAMRRDCMHLGPKACVSCPKDLSRICPVRKVEDTPRSAQKRIV
jgi:hypothetical protein